MCGDAQFSIGCYEVIFCTFLSFAVAFFKFLIRGVVSCSIGESL